MHVAYHKQASIAEKAFGQEASTLITIHLIASGHAREYLPGGGERHTVELCGPKTVRAILLGLGAQAELVMAVFIDGRRADLDAVPEDGSEVLLVSPTAGG